MTQSNTAKMRQTLASIRGVSYDQAHALPGEFYTSNDWLSIEREELFARQWVCVGRVEEVSQPGDYMAFDIAGEPIVITRDEDEKIHALSNVCRHRATVLAHGKGNARRFVCPYHHWSYDIAGKLIAAPSITVRDSFDPKNCRLPELRCEQWKGFIFVSLNPDASDLHEMLQPLDAQIGNYHLEDMQLKYVVDEAWPVNWKSMIENYMEGYHLTPLHIESLHKINPTKLCRHFTPGEGYFGYKVGFSTRVSEAQIGHVDLSEEERNTCVMVAVPPGLTIGIGSDYCSFLCIRPESPESVRVKIGLIFYGDSWQDDEVKNAVELFQKTMKEDEDVLINVRDGLRSKLYQPGPLAPADKEGTIWDLYQYLSRNLAAGG